MNAVSGGRPGLVAMAAWAVVGAGCAMAPARSDRPPPADRTTRPAPRTSPEPGPASLLEAVVEAHNRIRAEARLPALAVSEKLRAAAQLHAQDMAERREMTHVGSRGSSPFDRIKAQGYTYRRAGENVAAGRFPVDQLIKGWMDSPRHKRNILGGFSQIGVGCAIAADGKRYWCVTFGLPVRR